MLGGLAAARERERRLLADASHELRTPLTSLRGNVEYVARHGADPEVIADLESDAVRLGRLVEDLLALERESAPELPLMPLRLDELVSEAVAGRDGVVADLDGPVMVRGDAGGLSGALDNLLANAERHGPAGGEVRVAVSRVGDEARVAVTDQGAGFRPGTEEDAFGRFWRGAGTGAPGSGLGLAIVRATAERHGGRAWAEGSTVTLALPLDDRSVPPADDSSKV
jgi:two-component system sensor histidine kinase MprB